MHYPELDREKKRLRRLAAEIIGAQAKDSLTEASGRIISRVLASSLYRQAASVFVYVSTGREVDTRALIEDAWRTDKAVYVPKCRGQGRMDAVRVFSWQDLSPGAYGIPEPVGDSSDGLFPSIDLAVVPCVCASWTGQRLGHGAGYYDRFLENGADRAVCLCFEKMLRDDIPQGEHDVLIPWVLTEASAGEL